MDLCEIQKARVGRHFWEIAKTDFLQFLLRKYIKKDSEAADIGCGDCYVAEVLNKSFSFRSVWLKDPFLTKGYIERMQKEHPNFVFDVQEENDFSAMPETDLCMLLDVLEHVKDDSALLRELKHHVRPNGLFMITVPAFSSLFTDHDVFLKHFRRYNRRELCGIMRNAGLTVVDSGYFFASLLPIRFCQKLFSMKSDNAVGKGEISNHFINSLIAWVLSADARFCYYINMLGIHIPGLSCWLIAKKQTECR